MPLKNIINEEIEFENSLILTKKLCKKKKLKLEPENYIWKTILIWTFNTGKNIKVISLK